MNALYTPRRPRRLRLHKSIPRGRRPQRIRPAGSLANIYATGYGCLTWRRLEAGRRLLTRQLRRSKVRLRVHLNQPLTAKSKNARMGKGKGKLRGWTSHTRPGTLLYVVQPTPRKSWRGHRSPTTRLLGLFPFGRLNYKYSGGLAAVQRSGLAPWGEGNRRPRPHYPQRQQTRRLPPAHRSHRFFGALNPWQHAEGLGHGLGLWLGRCSAETTAPLQQLLASGGAGLLKGFLVGRRRAGLPLKAGEKKLQQWLQRRRLRRRRRWRRRLIRKLLKRLPQHWRRRRRAMGGLLEAWWHWLDRSNDRRLGVEAPHRGLLLALQGLQLLGYRLAQLQRRGTGAALRLLPRSCSGENLWPVVKGLPLRQLQRRRERLQRRRRLPLTSFYPTTKPLGLETPPAPAPELLTPGRLRRWRRRNWFIGWTLRRERRAKAFPELPEELYRSVATATGLPGRENAAVSGGYTAAKVAAEESDFTEAEPFRVAHPAAGAPGEESKEESKEVAEESPEDSATEPSGEENPATEPAPRRWRRRLNPEELLQQQLLEEELQDQELLALEAEPATAANAAEQRLNLELPLLPNEGRLEQWRRSVYRATSPENWSALQRRLAAPAARLLLRDRRRELAAMARIGGWLAGGDDASALLQRHQWRQKLALRGLTLNWRSPEGVLELGTPRGGALALGVLLPLLQRLKQRRGELYWGARQEHRRRHRLLQRGRRRGRIKARRRRFWRLTHRRRWFWWHRRRRRSSWRLRHGLLPLP